MLIEGSVISDVGKIRQNNEDNFFLNGLYRQNMQENSFEMTQKADGRRAVYAVCDGMGGEDYGEVASLCAVSALEVFKNNKWSDGVIEGYINSVKADMTEKSRKLLSEGMTAVYIFTGMESLNNLQKTIHRQGFLWIMDF